ncbi:hypothetical protein GCM10018963_72900 [Saccharothrix longispora]
MVGERDAHQLNALGLAQTVGAAQLVGRFPAIDDRANEHSVVPGCRANAGGDKKISQARHPRFDTSAVE